MTASPHATGAASSRPIGHRLENGLQVFALEDRRLPLVAIDVWYHVGSRHDPAERSGLAHLFEHMLFQGSKNVAPNEHFAHVQQVGGVANGSTWYDRTNYYETLPSNALDLGLWLESDRMGFLLEALDEEKLELQRSVVMNERRQRVDNQPYGKAAERLNVLLYGEDHPYGRPVIGWMRDIEAASLADLEHFFTEHYDPSNAVVVVAGDVAPHRAIERVQHYFGSLPSRRPALRRADGGTVRRPHPKPVHEQCEDDVGTGRVTLAWSLEGYGTTSWYAANTVAAVLASGKSSRLQQHLVRERQLATGVSAYILPTECCATFAINLSARPGVDLERLRGEAESVLVELSRSRPPRADELERSLACLQSDHLFGLQSLQPRADAIARGATFLDRPDHVFGEADLLRAAATPAAVGEVLTKLDPSRAVGMTVVPKDSARRAAS